MLKMNKKIHICATFAIVAAISLLAGCSRQEPAPAAAVAPATAPAAPPVPVAAPASAATPKWLASTQGQVPGITVAVQELKRGPYALKLKLVLINASGDRYKVWNTFYDSGGGGDTSAGVIDLIDMTNKKKYFVVRDHDGTCLCSRGLGTDLDNGSQLVMWAEYPLPPDDVQKISVEVPEFPPMEDVPISR